MVCPNCQVAVDAGDNFCRGCGVPLSGAILPLPAAEARAVVPLGGVAAVVARGAVALALTAAAEMALRMLARQLWRGPLSLVRMGSQREPIGRRREEDALPYEIFGESQRFVVRWIAGRQLWPSERGGRAKR